MLQEDDAHRRHRDAIAHGGGGGEHEGNEGEEIRTEKKLWRSEEDMAHGQFAEHKAGRELTPRTATFLTPPPSRPAQKPGAGGWNRPCTNVVPIQDLDVNIHQASSKLIDAEGLRGWLGRSSMENR